MQPQSLDLCHMLPTTGIGLKNNQRDMETIEFGGDLIRIGESR